MKMATENNAKAPDNNSFLDLFNPGSWSIKWKSKLNFLLRAIVAIGLLMLLVNFLQRNMTIRETNSKLALLSDTKSRFIEDYFNHLNQQIKSFSMERLTLEAFNQLNGAFQNIETDNYLTTSVTGNDRLNLLLEGFYNTEILPALGNDRSNPVTLKTLLPEDNKQRILQYLYIAANTKPLGLKGNMIKAEDGSAYSYMHSMYHPGMINFARQSGIADILFVDYRSGYVIYSMKKNLDFGTSLFEGPYKNSGLGMAFKSAIAQQVQGAISYTDATIYLPALYQPQLFISTPVFSGTQLLGAVIFAINNNTLDNLLTYNNENISAKESLKSIIIGNDFLYRCDDPEFNKDRPKYLRKLKNHSEQGKTSSIAARNGSTALVQMVDPIALGDALKGKEGYSKYTTETGAKVLCSYKPLRIDNLNWTLITQIDRSEAMSMLHRFLLMLIPITLVIAIVLYYLSGLINNSIITRLDNIKENIASLNRGEFRENNIIDSRDEIGFIGKALNNLSRRMHDSSVFITELSKGNLDQDFPLIDENDQFGISMNSVKESLVMRRADEEKRLMEDEIRNWSTQGIAMFNDIMRTDNNNLEKLSLNIIKNIVQYLSANQGGLFLMDEDDGVHYLSLEAAYAFDRQKFLKKRIEIGEGMAGTCVLEKKTILTNRIPSDYMMITSGLGGSRPTCLLIVPLKKEEEVLGVLEIASLESFKPHEVEFVEKIAESIASALVTVKLHLQTTQYLEKFQQQAEEMKAQDEELRQNIEELQATHEQMERLKLEEDERTQKMIKEMEDYRKLLISVINEVPEKIFLKDDQGRFIIANKPVAENYNRTVDEILGKSDFDFYPKVEADEYFRHEQDIIKSGRTQSFEEGDPSKGDGLIVRSIKKPFYIEHLGITGLFGVQFDISDIKRKEYEAKKLSEELSSKQLEIEAASIELRKETALLDALLTSVPECIYFKDRDSRFIRFSSSMLKLFGLEKPEDLLGKSDFDFFSEEHSRPAFDDEQRIIATGKAIIDQEEKEVMDDGRVSWVNTTKMPLKDAEGNIIGTFGISKSISKIKGLELKALEMMKTIDENRRLLIDILDKVPAKIFLKDENGTFVVVNSAVASVYDKTPEQIIGTTDYDNHPDEDVDSWRAQELEIISAGEKAYLHKENQHGKLRYLNTIKAPFVMATTGKTGLLGIQTDVTELRMLEDEVKKLREENKKLKK